MTRNVEPVPHRRGFLIVHGWQNRRPEGHWHRWLATELAARGYAVDYPQLPEPDRPVLDDWLHALEGLLRKEKQVVVCHSLGCIAWLNLAYRGSAGLPVDRVLLVAPPSPDFLRDEPALAGLQPPSGYGERLAASSRTPVRLVCGDDDPYCVRGAQREYPEVTDVDVVPGGGHLDMPAGYGAWPSVLAWCEDPTVRLASRSVPLR